ncbi:MAG: MFS transporter [Planctomycetaceae bacterium]|nr:MFS transporter [Planctomycetaceae bacterium]
MIYLEDHKQFRIATLCALYVAQGIPWGFVTVTFAAWLAQPGVGMQASQIGPIMAVASLPWSFKFIWAPILDRWTWPAWGRRRPWILFAQGMAILILSSMLFVDDPAALIWYPSPDGSTLSDTILRIVPGPLAAIILLANVFVSMQDVSVDALAVDLLEENERGRANGLMYGSSYLGTAIGGAGLGKIVALYGINAGLVGQALMLFLIMLLPLLTRERRSDRTKARSGMTDLGETPQLPPVSPEQASETSTDQPPVQLWHQLKLAFRVPATRWGMLIAVTSKVGIGVLSAVFVSHLLQHAGWTQEEYTDVTGGFAVALGLIGSVGGGLLADRFSQRTTILTTSLLLSLIWLILGMLPDLLHQKWLVVTLLLLEEFLLAILSVSLFSLFMAISSPAIAATQFTAYMALMNLSTTIGNYAAATLSVHFSIGGILLITGAFQALTVYPVIMIDTQQTRRLLSSPNAD